MDGVPLDLAPAGSSRGEKGHGTVKDSHPWRGDGAGTRPGFRFRGVWSKKGNTVDYVGDTRDVIM